jgi:hypothetical protein
MTGVVEEERREGIIGYNKEKKTAENVVPPSEGRSD